MQAKLKDKRCKNPGCEVSFTPRTSFQKVCGLPCSLIMQKIDKQKKQDKEFRAETKRRKEAIKTPTM